MACFIVGEQGDIRSIRFYECSGPGARKPLGATHRIGSAGHRRYTVFALNAEGRPLARTRLIKE
jgi:hypothetical protein